MNILPKKSWHVLSRDNVKKVRKDEAEAREREKELARRAALAEQEARIDFMRKRVRVSDESGGEETKQRKIEETPSTTEGDKPQHINFFSDLQTGIGLEGAVNKEHEQEKKAEQEKWEKRVGVLNYLVDKDSSSSDPWYLKRKDDKSLKSREKRSISDPLEEMKGYLKAKKKSLDPTSTTSTSRTVSSVKDEVVKSDKHKKKMKKQNKKDEKEEKKMMLKKLREDRKRREEEERVRTEKLLKRHYGLEDEVAPKTIEEIPGRLVLKEEKSMTSRGKSIGILGN